MKKNISYLIAGLLLFVGVLYSSHAAMAVCEVDCGDYPTITIPVPTIVFPTIVIPTIDFPFPSPTECLTPTPVECREDCDPTATPAPSATPPPTSTQGEGLTRTTGNQGDGRGDGLSSSTHADTNGQVLGLASTGTFTDSVMNSMFLLGIACALLGITKVYAKKS